MSFLACHVKKYGAGNLGGLERHILRKNENYTNACIDKKRTSENFDALNLGDDIQRVVKNKIMVSGAKARKDSVLYCSVIISSDGSFFEKLTESEKKDFFRKSAEWLAKNFAGGVENVVNASVHFDETTPHMHFGFVPLTDDGRLCAKEITSRKNLKNLQDKMPKFLQEAGFKIERGRENADSRKHITTDEYKAELKASLDAKKANSSDLLKERDRFAEISKENLSEGLFGMGKKVVKLPVREINRVLENYTKLKKTLERAEKAENECVELRKRCAKAEEKAEKFDLLKTYGGASMELLLVNARMRQATCQNYCKRLGKDVRQFVKLYGVDSILKWDEEWRKEKEGNLPAKIQKRSRDDYSR